MTSVVSQDYWDASYEKLPLTYAPESVQFKDIFHEYLPQGGSCFEIGCYPGIFLTYLGKNFNYKVSGVDLTPYVLTRLPQHLAKNGVQLGAFYKENISDFSLSQQFDIVCSFGFIEHFVNFEEIIQKHIDLVKPGGTVIMSCPNFRGLQRLFHATLDRANLERHVLNAMDLRAWAKILEKNEMEIMYQGYYRTADFWTDVHKPGKFHLRLIRLLIWFTKQIDQRLNLPNPWLSPYMISFSRKPIRN